MTPIKAVPGGLDIVWFFTRTPVMPLYCVVLKGADGSIAEERVIECVDDDEAIERAGDSEHPNEIEIWANTRLVARFPAMEAGSDYDRE